MRSPLQHGGARLQATSLGPRRELLAYVLLAFAISWAIELPLALVATGVFAWPIPFELHYFAAFGPMLAALSVAFLTQGRRGVRSLRVSALPWRIGARWLAISIGSPIALYGLATIGAHVLDGTWPDLERTGEVNFLGNVGLWVLVLWIGTFGFGEEVGWRGFALPRLQNRFGPLIGTLVLGLIWGAWHIPAFFYLPTYVALGATGFPGFLVGLLLGAIVLTWLYNSTGGSIFAVAMWHGLYDLVSASNATTSTVNALLSVAVTIVAIAILVGTHGRLGCASARSHRGPASMVACAD